MNKMKPEYAVVAVNDTNAACNFMWRVAEELRQRGDAPNELIRAEHLWRELINLRNDLTWLGEPGGRKDFSEPDGGPVSAGRWTKVRRRTTCAGCGDELYPAIRGVGGDLAYETDRGRFGEQCGCGKRAEADPEKTIPITNTLYLSEQDIADIIITGIESGIYHWCRKIRLRIPEQGFDPPSDRAVTEIREGEVWNEFIARNVAEGGTLTFYVEGKPETLTRENLVEGITRWYRDLGSGWDGDTGFIDGPAADLILQYALLGDYVYA